VTRTPIAVAAAALPILVSTALCVWWTRSDALILGGDEPHYLIMARSVGLDGDFDLRNNYEEDTLSGDIYGPVVPHAFRDTDVWPPYHSPGLGVLLAVPLREAGLSGVRLALIAWAAIIPICIFVWLREQLTVATAVLLAVALSLSVPVGYGAFAIYPDMPAAAIVTAATLACLDFGMRRAAPPLLFWVVLWALVGFTPWLQSRFAATWLLLVAGGIAVAALAPRSARWRLLIGVLPAVAGLGLLLWFNQVHYGSVFGPPRWGELTRSPARAAEIFLGLHLDQSQGLFLQQPIWLLGLIGLAWLARAHPIAAVWVAFVYLSAVLPGSLQLGRYGGAGPIGRYGWTASFLWVVPLRSLLESTSARGMRRFHGALVAIIIVLAAAAFRWMRDPFVLAPRLDDGLAVRDTLAPESMRELLPSFYFWDFWSYWSYPPNLAAIASLILLAAAGASLARDRSRVRSSRV
jgi:hypothetical protein